jgi:hypothetical protein
MPINRADEISARQMLEMREAAQEELDHLRELIVLQCAFARVRKLDIAAVLGVSANTVTRKMKNPREFSLEEILLLKQYLRIKTEYSA